MQHPVISCRRRRRIAGLSHDINLFEYCEISPSLNRGSALAPDTLSTPLQALPMDGQALPKSRSEGRGAPVRCCLMERATATSALCTQFTLHCRIRAVMEFPKSLLLISICRSRDACAVRSLPRETWTAVHDPCPDRDMQFIPEDRGSVSPSPLHTAQMSAADGRGCDSMLGRWGSEDFWEGRAILSAGLKELADMSQTHTVLLSDDAEHPAVM